MYKFGRTSMRRLTHKVNPILPELMIQSLSKSKYDMTIPWMGGFRTAKDQHGIYLEGNSRCDGYKILSYHQADPDSGLSNAVDCVAYVKGKASYKHLRRQIYFNGLVRKTWKKMEIEGKTKGWRLVWGGT